ncbi:MAG: hypothetical protein Fur0042_29390 [Cyanophyceae cyanobacterium]
MGRPLPPRVPRPLAQRLSRLLSPPSEAKFISYGAWRRQFVRQRLRLAFALGILYFSGYSSILAVYALQDGGLFYIRTVKHVVALLAMVLGFRWLNTPAGRRHPRLSLLLLFASVCIITNFPNQFDRPVPPDIKGWNLIFFGIATVTPFHWRLHLLCQWMAYGYYFAINAILRQPLFPPTPTPAELMFDMVWISGLATLVAYLYERLSKMQFRTYRTLRQERRRSQRLLLSILPAPIADRLLAKQETIADRFEEVSVLFADLVNFTQLAALVPPDRLVEMLNEIFSSFDRLADRHGVEKIKTVGDAYMAVAGVPTPRTDHADAMADLALAMLRAVERFDTHTGHRPQLRVGIHLGPVVAGVIGLNKFSYDLWGDTVNVASRMESHGRPGRIQVTAAVYERLRSRYAFERRGEIEVKGKGTLETYWLVAALPSDERADKRENPRGKG